MEKVRVFFFHQCQAKVRGFSFATAFSCDLQQEGGREGRRKRQTFEVGERGVFQNFFTSLPSTLPALPVPFCLRRRLKHGKVVGTKGGRGGDDRKGPHSYLVPVEKGREGSKSKTAHKGLLMDSRTGGEKSGSAGLKY